MMVTFLIYVLSRVPAGAERPKGRRCRREAWVENAPRMRAVAAKPGMLESGIERIALAGGARCVPHCACPHTCAFKSSSIADHPAPRRLRRKLGRERAR